MEIDVSVSPFGAKGTDAMDKANPLLPTEQEAMHAAVDLEYEL